MPNHRATHVAAHSPAVHHVDSSLCHHRAVEVRACKKKDVTSKPEEKNPKRRIGPRPRIGYKDTHSEPQGINLSEPENCRRMGSTPCTSTSPTIQTVTVNVFDQDGVASGAGTISLFPNNTVMFGTRNANGLLADVITGAVGTSKGYAQILSTSTLLMCTAFVSDVVHLTPMGMTSLNVIKGTTQQGE